MKVAIATDHNGVEQKIDLIYFISSLGYEVVDYSKDNTPTDDYPDFAERVAKSVSIFILVIVSFVDSLRLVILLPISRFSSCHFFISSL